MLQVAVQVCHISAVLWDPDEAIDQENDYTYLILIDSQELLVVSKLPAGAFLTELFGYGTSFVTDSRIRCPHALPTTEINNLCLALVPSNVITVLAQQEPDPIQQLLLLRGRHDPLLITTPFATRELCAWLWSLNW